MRYFGIERAGEMGNEALVRDRLQAMLIDNFDDVRLESTDGTYLIQHGPTYSSIELYDTDPEDDGRPVMVRISITVLNKLSPSPELYEHVAHRWHRRYYGRWVLAEDDDGTLNLGLVHYLLGDYLDEDELIYAATTMVHLAEDLDVELQTTFGGRRLR